MSSASSLQSLGYIYKVAVLLLPFEMGGLGVENGVAGDFCLSTVSWHRPALSRPAPQ